MTHPTMIEMLRDAKRVRDEAGRPDPKADELLARAEAGDYRDTSARHQGIPTRRGDVVTGVTADPGHITGKRFTYARPGPGGDGMVRTGRQAAPAHTGRPMTDPQASWITTLLGMVPTEVAAQARPWFEANRAGMTAAQASDVITRLKRHAGIGDRPAQAPSAPVAAPAPVTVPGVNRPAGNPAWSEWRRLAAELVELGGQHGARFAVPSRTGTNDLDFWMIAKHEGNRGMRFYLRRVIGGQPDRDTRMAPETMVEVARSIMTDPREAMLRYGRELGHCGHCGRHLTDATSRAYGKGPVCRAKAGW